MGSKAALLMITCLAEQTRRPPPDGRPDGAHRAVAGVLHVTGRPERENGVCFGPVVVRRKPGHQSSRPAGPAKKRNVDVVI